MIEYNVFAYGEAIGKQEEQKNEEQDDDWNTKFLKYFWYSALN